MSTKATNQALINAIADGEPNSALEARTAWNGLLNELYPTVYRTKWDANVKTVQLQIRFRYDFIFWKQGNTVFVNGSFTTIGNVLADGEVMSFTDAEFANLNNGVDILNMVVDLGGYPFRLTNGSFVSVGVIPSGTTANFNFSYPTNP